MFFDKTVLVVDDDPLILGSFTEMLSKHFDTVWIAKNGEDAWQLFLKHRPDYVVTDIEMPLLDGLELLHKIKKTSPYVPVVLVSAYDYEEYRDAGADLFFTKPLRVKTLLKSISELGVK